MKIKIWPKDAKGFMEKTGYVLMYVAVPFVYIYMQLSAFGVFNNFYATACKSAGWGWKIPGLILTAAFVYSIYELAEDHNDRLDPKPLHIGTLMVLSLAVYCGFAYPYIF